MIKQLGPSLRTQRKVGLFVVFYEGDFNSTTLLKDSWREKTCFSYRTFTLVLSEINSGNFVNEKVARCRGIWIPEPRAHIMLVESEILAVQLKQSGISLTMGIQNPNSTDKESGLPLSGIRKRHRPQWGIENPGLGWITSHRTGWPRWIRGNQRRFPPKYTENSC